MSAVVEKENTQKIIDFRNNCWLDNKSKQINVN